MSTIEHVLSGSGAPTAIPPSACAHYLDVSTGQLWIAHGVSSPEDWRPQAGTLAATFADAGTVEVPAGVSHVRIMAVGPPMTLRLNIAHPTHRAYDSEGPSFRAALDIEIVQSSSNLIGTQVIAAPGISQARIIGNEQLAGWVEDGQVHIPSRSDPWYALLKAVVADGVLTIYALAVEEPA